MKRNWDDVVFLDHIGVDGMSLSDALMKYADSEGLHSGHEDARDPDICNCPVCQTLVPMARKLEDMVEKNKIEFQLQMSAIPDAAAWDEQRGVTGR